MRQFLMILLGVAALSFGSVACHHSEKADASACASCAAGKGGETIWCKACDAGYVKGDKVACAGCFAAKTGGPACTTCAAKGN